MGPDMGDMALLRSWHGGCPVRVRPVARAFRREEIGMSIDIDQIALARRPIPAMAPVPLSDWLQVTGHYGPQLKEKARVIRERRESVLMRLPGSEMAETEFGEVLIEALSTHEAFAVEGAQVTRPDGRLVRVDGSYGLELAGQLIQEDVCLLEKRGGEHVLTAALLAFPASWSLSEKIGRPLSAIHVPVAAYDAGIAARVQRMFDGLAPGRILTRANLLRYADPALYQPRSETAPPRDKPAARAFFRSERQTLRKLPRSEAIVFTILTSVAPMEGLAQG